ncbi:DUF4142 domain-containing protein [Alcaligenes faecalis]|uniref:DUF4142 domain-containing protein n=1 Tax=Alcaligenes faecalis TaxID=511 RepID=UPI001F4038B4|nr:DUF4142 domain-containing protein [Alcaligenes faecalis]
MRVRHLMCLALAAGLVLGLSVRSASAIELFSPDKGFLRDAAQSGHFEVKAAKLALERSNNDRVVEFAQMMIDDHEQLAKELQTLAQTRKVELPTEPSLMQRGKISMLEGAEGEQFDADYANEAAVKAHEDTIKLFEDYIKDGKDKEVMGFAQDALPMLQQHLRHAHALADSMKPAVAQ